MLFYTRDPVTIQLLRTLSAKTFLIYHFFFGSLKTNSFLSYCCQSGWRLKQAERCVFLFKKITIKSLGSMSIRKVFDEECLHFLSSSSKNWIFFSAPHQFGRGNKLEMTKRIKLLYTFCRKVLKGKKSGGEFSLLLLTEKALFSLEKYASFVSCVTRNTSTNCYLSYFSLLQITIKHSVWSKKRKILSLFLSRKTRFRQQESRQKNLRRCCSSILSSYWFWFCEDDKVKIKQL